MSVLADLAPHTLRLVWAACAADPATPLSPLHRIAILDALIDRKWFPPRYFSKMPQVSDIVDRWYAELQGQKREVVETLC